jgi:hypothetical protein
LAPAAASAGEEQNRPPLASASRCAFSAVWDHSATSCPACKRLRAMG